MPREGAKTLEPAVCLSFYAVADILVAYETAWDTWYRAAINGTSSFSKVFPVSAMEGQILSEKAIYTVSQLMEMDDLTGWLTMGENRALMLGLAPFSIVSLGIEELALFVLPSHKIFVWKPVPIRNPVYLVKGQLGGVKPSWDR